MSTLARVVLILDVAHRHEPVSPPLDLAGDSLRQEPGQVPAGDAEDEGVVGGGAHGGLPHCGAHREILGKLMVVSAALLVAAYAS